MSWIERDAQDYTSGYDEIEPERLPKGYYRCDECGTKFKNPDHWAICPSCRKKERERAERIEQQRRWNDQQHYSE